MAENLSVSERTERTLFHMKTYGGSFVRHMAHAYEAADAKNRARIEAAFPELWERYAPENWGKRV